jgi:hypothetical protein
MDELDPTLASNYCQGHSSAESLKSATGQFNAFLLYFRQKVAHASSTTAFGGEPVTASLRIKAQNKCREWFGKPEDVDLPADHDCTLEVMLKNKKAEFFQLHDLDRFAKYLATDARSRQNGRGHERLSLGAADRYLSAIKCLFIKHGYHHNYRHVFDQAKSCSSVRAGMYKQFLSRHMEEGTAMSNSRTTSTGQDMEAITLLCVYQADAKYAQLAFYMMLLYHLAGRAGEVAAIPYKNVRTHVPPEFESCATSDLDCILQIRLWRVKTASLMLDMQDLSVFNHRHDWRRCAPFLFSYSMVMQLDTDPSPYLFPSFRPHLSEDERKLSVVEEVVVEEAEDDDDDGQPTVRFRVGESPSSIANSPGRGSNSPAPNSPDAFGQAFDQSGNPFLDQAIRDATRREPDAESGSPLEDDPEPVIQTPTRNNSQKKKKRKSSRKKKKKSNVSNYVGKLFKALLDYGGALSQIMEETENNEDESNYYDTSITRLLGFNVKIGGHGHKRRAVNDLNNCPGLKTTWAVFRCGWMMKSIHTMYDYLDRSIDNDRSCGRATAGWDVNPSIDGVDMSGRPPTLAALFPLEDAENAWSIASAASGRLYSRYLDSGLIDWNMSHYLFAVLLLNLEDFIRTLASHPRKAFGHGDVLLHMGKGLKYVSLAPNDPLRLDYDKLCQHRFMQELHFAGNDNVDIFKFLELGQIINKDYVRRNWNFLDWVRVERVLGDSPYVSVDTRSVSTGLRQLSREMLRIREDVKDNVQRTEHIAGTVATRREVRDLQRTVQAMEGKLDTIIEILEGSKKKRPRLQPLVPQEPVVSPEGSAAGDDSVSSPCPGTPETIVAITPTVAQPIAILPENCGSLKIHDIMKRWVMDYWHKCKVKGDRAYNSRINIVRQVISYYCLFLQAPVPFLPHGGDGFRGVSAISKQWRKDFFRVIDDAWVLIQEFFVERGVVKEKQDYEKGYTFKDLMYKLSDPRMEWPEPSASVTEHCFLLKVSKENNHAIKSRNDLLQSKTANQQRVKNRQVTMAKKKEQRAAQNIEGAQEAT